MTIHIRLSMAAIAAAGSLGLACAATPTLPDSGPVAAKPVTFVKEPIASVSKPAQAGDALEAGIAEALNQGEGLAGAKITVQNDNGVVYLMGAALSQEQAKRAADIAREKAGADNVVSVIQPDKTTYRSWERLG